MGCCNKKDNNRLIRETYGSIAKEGGSCCGSFSSCGCGSSPDPIFLAEALGYDAEVLAGLPDGANLGLSCGNPVGQIELSSGEVVLDLGSGAGFDAFIAARRVGDSGHVIGVDMTPEMIARAEENAVRFTGETGLNNVEFRPGDIEDIPVSDGSIDTVISNCVLNLSDNKEAVWREIARVLKPGGRVVVADISLLKTLPDALKDSAAALTGCIAGAVTVDETLRMIRDAGLVDARAGRVSDAVHVMSAANGTLYHEISGALAGGESLADYLVGVTITARKPD